MENLSRLSSPFGIVSERTTLVNPKGSSVHDLYLGSFGGHYWFAYVAEGIERNELTCTTFTGRSVYVNDLAHVMTIPGGNEAIERAIALGLYPC